MTSRFSFFNFLSLSTGLKKLCSPSAVPSTMQPLHLCLRVSLSRFVYSFLRWEKGGRSEGGVSTWHVPPPVFLRFDDLCSILPQTTKVNVKVKFTTLQRLQPGVAPDNMADGWRSSRVCEWWREVLSSEWKSGCW